MNDANAVKLVTKYKFLSNSLSDAPVEYASSFQLFLFECGDGWFDLLDRTFSKMLVAARYPEDIFISQVKEKWAGLRIYFSCHADDAEALRSITYAAEDESFHICEVCGREGSIREIHGFQTLCDEHYNERLEYYKKIEGLKEYDLDKERGE